jgi:hypothetical protein
MRERAHEGKRESRMSARTTALGLNATAAAGRSYVPRDSPTAGARVAALSGVEPRSGTVADDPRCQQTDAGHGGDRAFRRRRVLGPVGTLVCLAATRNDGSSRVPLATPEVALRCPVDHDSGDALRDPPPARDRPPRARGSHCGAKPPRGGTPYLASDGVGAVSGRPGAKVVVAISAGSAATVRRLNPRQSSLNRRPRRGRTGRARRGAQRRDGARPWFTTVTPP